MTDKTERLAPWFLWHAVKRVQESSPTTLTDAEVLRLMGIPADAAAAAARIRELEAALAAMREERQ